MRVVRVVRRWFMIRSGGLRFQPGEQGQKWKELLMEEVLLARDVQIIPKISDIPILVRTVSQITLVR